MTDEELQEWLDGVVERFKSNPDRKQLYEEVDAAAPLVARRSQDEYWSSSIKNGHTIIEVFPCMSPEAALAHELLHARLKIRGYKQYCTCIDHSPKQGNLLELLPMLDNELQHAKLFGDFMRLGFRSEEMYADSDANWANYLGQRIDNLSPEKPLESFLAVYMTLIAPGGFGSADERRELELEIEKRCAPGYWKRLKAIRRAIAEYRDSQTLDAQTVVLRVLEELGSYEPVWIGCSQDFPTAGFFIGQPFNFDQQITT
jgi:hypothetical protein